MTRRIRSSVLPLACLVLLAAATPRPVEAGTSEALLALAAPLAEQFGVPASSVTALLEGGVSLETVTQLLLIQESAKKPLDDVTSLYRKSNDVTATARELGVDPKDYSQARVDATIAEAKEKATADATDRATEEASGAIGNAIKGWGR